MYSRQQVIDMALQFPLSAADMPFEEDFFSTVLRHADTGKWFGLILKAPRAKVGLRGEGDTVLLNLKCDPLVSFGMRQQYPDVIPAYHMNKQLWISIRLEGSLPEDALSMLMEMSYRLTARKPGRAGGIAR